VSLSLFVMSLIILEFYKFQCFIHSQREEGICYTNLIVVACYHSLSMLRPRSIIFPNNLNFNCVPLDPFFISFVATNI
jgi:hypothetical protein